MVTSGPGITNMITPILVAINDSSPLVVFSGQVSQEAQGLNSFQEAPAVELTRQVTKWSYQITDIYEMESSDRAFEEEVQLSGFGSAPVKSEGSAIAYDTAQEVFTARYNHETVALGFSITCPQVTLRAGFVLDAVARLGRSPRPKIPDIQLPPKCRRTTHPI